MKAPYDGRFRIETPYKVIRLREIDPTIAFEQGCEALLPWDSKLKSKAEGLIEGKIEGKAEGKLDGKRESLRTAFELRFPHAPVPPETHAIERAASSPSATMIP